MGIFASSEQLYECIGGLFHKLEKNDEVKSQMKAANLVIRFNYFDPEATITIDAAEGRGRIVFGDCEATPDVELTMSADIAHKFWLDKINVIAAVSKREIILNGPISKVMSLIPLIKSAFKIYPQHLRDLGHEKLLGDSAN